MKKYNRHFTLVEMLTVVAIIGILAGLIIPTVVISQKKGRVTQAKTDISILVFLRRCGRGRVTSACAAGFLFISSIFTYRLSGGFSSL